MSETNTVQPASVGTHDGWEVHSSSIDQPRPEQIVERLTDVPDDRQVEQEAAALAKEEQPAVETKGDQPATEEQKKKSASVRDAELKARIAAETKAYHDARRAREFEQSEIIRLRKEREELAKVAEKPAKALDKPVWAKFEEDGKSYEEFLDARAEYDRAQTIELTRAEQAKAREEEQRRGQEHLVAERQRAAAQAYDKRVADTVAKHPDFMEVVKKNLSDVPDTPFLVDVIQGHEQGPELLYHLAQNPDEARVLSTLDMSRPVMDAIRFSDDPIQLLSFFSQQPQELDRLNRLHPASALVALGEMKARLTGAKDDSPVNEKVSNAKPPIRSVGGGRTSAPKSSDDLPFGPEWIKAENARDRERKSRSSYF